MKNYKEILQQKKRADEYLKKRVQQITDIVSKLDVESGSGNEFFDPHISYIENLSGFRVTNKGVEVSWEYDDGEISCSSDLFIPEELLNASTEVIMTYYKMKYEEQQIQDNKDQLNTLLYTMSFYKDHLHTIVKVMEKYDCMLYNNRLKAVDEIMEEMNEKL